MFLAARRAETLREIQVLLYVLPQFVHADVALVRSSQLTEQGVITSTTKLAELRRRGGGVLDYVGSRHARLRPERLWDWAPGALEAAVRDWDDLQIAPTELDRGIERLLREMQIVHAPRPDDPVFGRWREAAIDLVQHYGAGVVEVVLDEAARDPDSVFPPVPETLSMVVYPLWERARRRFVSVQGR